MYKRITLHLSRTKCLNSRYALSLVRFHKLQGTDNVYAIGDCATMDQSTLVSKWEKLFTESDVNNVCFCQRMTPLTLQDGLIDMNEFKELCVQMGRRYPALLVRNVSAFVS